MKQITTLFFAICFSFMAKAQISISSADVAEIGTVLPRIIDNSPAETLLPGNTGENFIWDFSAIAAEDQDTIKFIAVEGTPYEDEFPDADFCIRLGAEIDYAYATNSSIDLKIQGASRYIDELEENIVVHFNPQQTSMLFPASYGDSFTDDYGFSLVKFYGESVSLPGFPFPIMVDSIKIVNNTHSSSTFDAWGELITPYGDFNVLRNWRVDYMENELYAKNNTMGFWIDVTSWLGNESADTVSVYSWWANNVGYPVFEIRTDYNTGEVNKASCLEVEDLSALQAKNTVQPTSAFPIPASDRITVQTNYFGNGIINIFDMTGSLVVSERFSSRAHSINVSHLSESLYFYNIITANQEKIGQGKFYVVH